MYIAPDNYIEQAALSVDSLKKSNPSISTAVVTNRDTLDEKIKQKFEHIIPTNTVFGDMRDKAFNIELSPFNRTLFVDCDVHFAGDISPIFELLDEFHFSAAHAPVRESNKSTGIPETFPEFNGGVLAFKKSEKVNEVFRKWKIMYEHQVNAGNVDNPLNDQTPLQEALWCTNIDIATLPPEYNCRFIFPGHINRDVKILHGHIPESMDIDLYQLEKIFNNPDGHRLYTGYPDQRLLYTTPRLKSKYYPQRLNYFRKIFVNSIKERGIIKTLRQMSNFLR